MSEGGVSVRARRGERSRLSSTRSSHTACRPQGAGAGAGATTHLEAKARFRVLLPCVRLESVDEHDDHVERPLRGVRVPRDDDEEREDVARCFAYKRFRGDRHAAPPIDLELRRHRDQRVDRLAEARVCLGEASVEQGHLCREKEELDARLWRAQRRDGDVAECDARLDKGERSARVSARAQEGGRGG